ncbi:MAG TPA: hypothetical protein VFI38_08605 [Candidatus Acidoferrum sp.]|nr:hypothetical protein [Candidatus Acidoferrum sp.]
MAARTSTRSGPKADGSHPVAYAILSGVAVGLFLPVIGLLLDSRDTYFNVLLPASFSGGAIVAFFVWRRERQTSFFQPRGPFETGYGHVDPGKLRHKEVWTPESKHLVPFGPGGVGQWTAHPIGLVIVLGLVLMGLVSRTPVRDLMLLSLVGGAVVGMLLWLYHR